MHAFMMSSRQSCILATAVQVGPSIVIAIAANKQDLQKQQTVTSARSESYAASIDALHVGTSAKTGEGLVEIFQAIADQVVARLDRSGTNMCCCHSECACVVANADATLQRHLILMHTSCELCSACQCSSCKCHLLLSKST